MQLWLIAFIQNRHFNLHIEALCPSPPRFSDLTVFFLPLESPRDASNKDSPASQADSGVYSIASSSSPSKGDSAQTAESTSPESPNRDRMTYSEQNYNRDMQCE